MKVQLKEIKVWSPRRFDVDEYPAYTVSLTLDGKDIGIEVEDIVDGDCFIDFDGEIKIEFTVLPKGVLI